MRRVLARAGWDRSGRDHTQSWQRLFSSLLCVLPLLVFASESQPRAVVLYPDMRQPYSKVFEDIISGISVGFSGEIIRAPLQDGGDFAGQTWTANNSPDVIIALGNRGYEAARDLGIVDVPVVLAGVSETGSHAYSGIAVLPDPAVVLARLKLLAPRVTRVHVLVREDGDGEYNRLIREAADSDRLQTVVHACADFRDCARAVRDITESNPGRTDALWLADPGAVDNTILGLILENAWRQRFVVLSNNPAHVRRGVLFALYPNNQKMGETLGGMANRAAANGYQPEGILPLQDVSLAVNLRTGSHIGLIFDRNVRNQIDLVFPTD